MNGSTVSQPVTLQVIRDETEWNLMESEWADLYDVSPRASPPLHPVWTRRWWQVYDPRSRRGGKLQILAVRCGSKLVGVLPLYETAAGGSALGVRSLRFLSTGEEEFEETCPDYLDLLCRSGAEEACLTAIRDFLVESSWDVLDLVDLREASPLVSPTFLNSLGLSSPHLRESVCPIADLKGGFESYLSRLSSNSRQQARRLLREGEKNGVIFELARESQADEFFADLARLHQERWQAEGKPGCFVAERFTAFHQSVIREWLPNGRAVLARLSLAGQPVAVLYGFVTGPKFEFYQSGIRMTEAATLRSPGNLAHLLLMRELSQKGIECYDFLRGQSTYKERLATGQNRLVSLRVWRPTLRSAIYRSARFLRRAGGMGLRRLLPT